jgi:hypothetical protein
MFVLRFCIKVRVMDHTESANFVIFDTQASSLFNRSCADMIQGTEPVCFVHFVLVIDWMYLLIA